MVQDRLIVGTFTQYSMSHHFAGTWRLDEEATGNRGYMDIDTWIDVARISEEAKVDFLMWADTLGQGGYFDGDLETPIREGIYNRADPSMLAAALSRETTNLGLVITSSMIQDHPFHFARRMSTLDWLTDGRLGWNVVASYNPGMWRNFGLPDLDHAERYAWLDEYMDVVYKLWEGSWERDAPVHSVERNTWADPTKVHLTNHESAHYSIKGPHQVEPSPQGTPVLFQAGSSADGARFAAKHAEVQFIGGAAHPDAAGEYVRRVRNEAESFGRDPSTLVFAPAITFAVGETEQEARRKYERYVDHFSYTGLAAKLNNMIGFDASKMDGGVPMDALGTVTGGIQGALDGIKRHFPDGHTPSLEEFLRVKEASGITYGTPEQIADRIEQLWEKGINGLLVSCMTRPGSIKDFAEMVAPELQRRGLMQSEYAPGTLRQKLYGQGDLLPDHHPGASYRPRSDGDGLHRSPVLSATKEA